MKKTNKVLLAILSVVMLSAFGFIKSEAQVTDKDGNVYKTVTIGTQEWTSENLNVEHYRNGDLIPQVQNKKEWLNLTTGAWCYYNNDSANGKTYGKLYNWFAVNDSRGLAPEGWHIPSDTEWTILTDFLGGAVGGKLKATTLWQSPNTEATNESGFTGLPGGGRGSNGRFDFIGKFCFFWSASEDVNGTKWNRNLRYNRSDVGRDGGNYEKDGLSVRCVRD
ncbi:MAG: fibrobacter succinogenes major paralogous domain-containing protein [Ignavibacteriae bacterium]|nr:fibrobacter succinogenes major paralogous domain-containing protein [Ignavibacteriota bacterium]